MGGRLVAANGGGRSNVVRFSDGAYAAFRLLLLFLDDLVGHEEGLRAQVEQIHFSHGAMIIDSHAAVFTSGGAPDMHFTLLTREGRKVFLITSLVPLMASFVAGYLIRRQEGDPELVSCL